MTEKKHFIFVALYALFVLFYLRFILLRPYELPEESHFSDFYFTFFVWKQQSILIDKGFMPFGTFWLSNHIGGIPVSLVPNNGWEDSLNLVDTVIFRMTGDPVATLKILIFGIFSISTISSWVYGYQITKQQIFGVV